MRPCHTYVLTLASVAFAAFAPVASRAADESAAPAADEAMKEELRYITALVEAGLPDFAEPVIAAAKKMAQQLDVSDQVQFVTAELSTFDIRQLTADLTASRVDMTISLHACDTATDEALAKGVEWKSRYIVSAPCCQHELQKTLGQTGADTSAFAGVLRHGILRERLCDILTDSFRAMILRILGFKTQVVEFVSPDATARNILLRAEYGVKPGQGGAVSDYLNLRDWWRVTPWLESNITRGLIQGGKRRKEAENAEKQGVWRGFERGRSV